MHSKGFKRRLGSGRTERNLALTTLKSNIPEYKVESLNLYALLWGSLVMSLYPRESIMTSLCRMIIAV